MEIPKGRLLTGGEVRKLLGIGQSSHIPIPAVWIEGRMRPRYDPDTVERYIRKWQADAISIPEAVRREVTITRPVITRSRMAQIQEQAKAELREKKKREARERARNKEIEKEVRDAS